MARCIYRWVFLFDKVMLVCRKPRAVFDQRYVVKTVYEVAQLRVEPMLHQPRAKVSRGFSHPYSIALSPCLSSGPVWAPDLPWWDPGDRGVYQN